jgi:hypothetical protein
MVYKLATHHVESAMLQPSSTKSVQFVKRKSTSKRESAPSAVGERPRGWLWLNFS